MDAANDWRVAIFADCRSGVFLPLLTTLAVNSFYLAFFGFLAIAIGFLIYYLLK